MKRPEREELELEADDPPPKRVAIVKTLHIPENVLFEMVNKFMDEKGLSTDGYEFIKWDIHKEMTYSGNRGDSETEELVFKGLVLKKVVLKELSNE